MCHRTSLLAMLCLVAIAVLGVKPAAVASLSHQMLPVSMLPLVLLASGLGLLFFGARPARPNLQLRRVLTRFDPGQVIANWLLIDLLVQAENGLGKRSKFRLTLHSIHGPNPATPHCLVGFCHKRQVRLIVPVAEITSPTNLDSGETYDSLDQALRHLIERA